MLTLVGLVSCLVVGSLGYITITRRVVASEIALLSGIIWLHAAMAFLVAVFGSLQIQSGSAMNFALSQDDLRRTGFLLLGTAAFIIFSTAVLAKTARMAFGIRTAVPLTLRDTIGILSGSSILNLIVPIGFLFSAALWAIAGNQLISRATYFAFTPGSLAGSLSFLTLPIGAAVAYRGATATRNREKLFAVLVLASLLIAEFSRASRGFAALIACCVVALIVHQQGHRVRQTFLVVVGLCAVLLSLSLVIQLRGSTLGQGLVGYLHYATSSLHFDVADLAVVANNLLLTVAVTFSSAQLPVPPGYLTVSLNPELGDGAGWYQISPYLSLGYQTPSNAIGQLIAAGPFAYIIGWLVIVAILSLTANLRNHLGTGPRLVALFSSLGLTLAACLQFLQYSLRAGMRFLWLSLLIAVVIHLAARLGAKRASSTAPVLTRRTS